MVEFSRAVWSYSYFYIVPESRLMTGERNGDGSKRNSGTLAAETPPTCPPGVLNKEATPAKGDCMTAAQLNGPAATSKIKHDEHDRKAQH